MKKLVVFAALCGLLVSGCATKGYVNEQVQPLQQRMDALEQNMKDCCGRVDAAEARSQRAEAAAGQALTVAERAEGKADQALRDAEAARRQAEAALQKKLQK